MPVYDVIHYGQPNARALKFMLCMQALKNAEELIGVTHIKTNAIITDAILAFAVQSPAIDLDNR